MTADLNVLLPDILILAAGLIICFSGYKFFRISLAILGGVIGFYIGGLVYDLIAPPLMLMNNVVSYWAVRGVFAVALGGLAFALYMKALVAVTTLGLGYWISGNLRMTSGDMSVKSVIVTWLIGLAIGFAVGLTVYYVQKWTITLFTAIAGAKLAANAVIPHIITFKIVEVSAQKLEMLIFDGNVTNGVSVLSGMILIILSTAGFLKQMKKV